MRMIVKPDASGLISAAGRLVGTILGEGVVLVEVDTESIPTNSAARLKGDGTVEIVANWIGSGPWFLQDAPAPADGRQTVKTIRLSEIDGATVDRLTAIEIDALDFNPEAAGWKMEPRAETKAEKAAREQAEAETLAAKERERIANLTVPLFAIRKVFRDAKAEDDTSYLAKVEEAKAAGLLSDDAYEAITMLDPVKRSSPYIGEFKTVFGFSDPEVDALFLAAEAVPV